MNNRSLLSSFLNPLRLLLKISLVPLFLIAIIPNAFAGMAELNDRSTVNKFIAEMVNEYGFSGPDLAWLFEQVKVRRDILVLMKAPKESSPWFVYRNFFVTDKRAQEGVDFWKQHEKILAEAQKTYGVPPGIIVAIIGIETNYGKVMGKYRVMDALSTLAFNYPPRRTFFRYELEQYLLLSREQGFKPLAITGSYAGAMGMPQFMPSNYRRYAVSADGHDDADLLDSGDDAILSVANFFQKFGWQSGQPVAVLAKVSDDNYQSLLNNNAQPTMTLEQFSKYGIQSAIDLSPDNANTKATLIRLKMSDGYQYWLVFNNFYVITQYNTSVLYAMAVYQLAEQIQALKGTST